MGCPVWILYRAFRTAGKSTWEWKAEVASLRSLGLHDITMASCWIGRVITSRCTTAALALFVSGVAVCAQAPSQKQQWKSVEFAIVKFNDEAPKSWNLYHTEKKGVFLLHLWKRYLLVDMKEEEVYEIDPQTVKPAGDNVEWSLADKPGDPIETVEWKSRDIGPMRRTTLRLGKNGHVLDLQIPLKINGQPMY